MGRSPSITIGDAKDGLRVEHVKGRGMVRLVRWTAGGVEDDGVGLEVSDFCTRLGLTTDVLGPSAHYLLVAGAERPGAGHVVSLFESEEDARAAFVTVRRSDPGSEAWAEVTRLSPCGELRRICWFGTPATASHPIGPKRTKRHDRMLRRLLRRKSVAWRLERRLRR
jgi:hypothetical protein